MRKMMRKLIEKVQKNEKRESLGAVHTHTHTQVY